MMDLRQSGNLSSSSLTTDPTTTEMDTPSSAAAATAITATITTSQQLPVVPDQNNDRLKILFHKLDTDGDGRINSSDLIEALKKKGIVDPGEEARKIIAASDMDNSGDVNFHEFVNYVTIHERHLRSVFKNLDRNDDGLVDINELMDAFIAFGVRLSREEVEKMIKRMVVRDGKAAITWEDWRDYLLMSPSAEFNDLLHFWRHNTHLDYGGETTTIPIDDDYDSMDTFQIVVRHLCAGGVAGAVSRTCTAPLDRIKVFLQVHGKGSSTTRNGMYNCVTAMIREGGVFSLWRGNLVNVVKIAPESALKFMAYEQGKRFFKSQHVTRELQMSERFLAGSLAGAFSQSVIYPLEVIKTRLALRKTGQYHSIHHLVKQMYTREGGPRAFYKGYLPNLLGILPYAGIDLAVYETLKKIYLSRYQPLDVPHPTGVEITPPPTLLLLTCGMVSSACGQLASYPLALVRTRLQAKTDYGSSMSCLFKTIWVNEGIVGLYRGLLPNFMKVAPAVSISYVVYEKVRTKLGVEMS